jgi:hypothetical protein
LPESAGGRTVEHLFGLICLLYLAAALWGVWYYLLVRVTPLASRRSDRLLVYALPLVPVLILAICAGARWLFEPRPPLDRFSVGFGGGVLWLALIEFAFPWLGLSARDDVAERRNRAAGWAMTGAQVGLTLCYAIPVALVDSDRHTLVAMRCGFLGTFALFVLWGILEWWAGLSEAITVDRDAGTALRLALFLPALGLVIGRAAITVPEALETKQLLLPHFAPLVLLLAALIVEPLCIAFHSRLAGAAGNPSPFPLAGEGGGGGERQIAPVVAPPARRDFGIGLAYLIGAGFLLLVMR